MTTQALSRPPADSRRYIFGLSAIVVLFLALPFLVKGNLSTPFLPHVYCYLNDSRLIAASVITDTLIWLSYLTITAAR